MNLAQLVARLSQGLLCGFQRRATLFGLGFDLALLLLRSVACALFTSLSAAPWRWCKVGTTLAHSGCLVVTTSASFCASSACAAMSARSTASVRSGRRRVTDEGQLFFAGVLAVVPRRGLGLRRLKDLPVSALAALRHAEDAIDDGARQRQQHDGMPGSRPGYPAACRGRWLAVERSWGLRRWPGAGACWPSSPRMLPDGPRSPPGFIV